MKDKLLELLNNSYSPYSHYPVAAILVTKDGREFSGVNVEDASYRAGTCAERGAIFSAIASGIKKHDIKEIHIMVSGTDVGTPCGTCRQMIYEICDKDTLIRCYNKNGDYKDFTIDELCPHFFGESNLQ